MHLCMNGQLHISEQEKSQSKQIKVLNSLSEKKKKKRQAGWKPIMVGYKTDMVHHISVKFIFRQVEKYNYHIAEDPELLSERGQF